MIDKSWFNHLGKYDTQMDIWGGENFGKLRMFQANGTLMQNCSPVFTAYQSFFCERSDQHVSVGLGMWSGSPQSGESCIAVNIKYTSSGLCSPISIWAIIQELPQYKKERGTSWYFNCCLFWRIFLQFFTWVCIAPALKWAASPAASYTCSSLAEKSELLSWLDRSERYFS